MSWCAKNAQRQDWYRRLQGVVGDVTVYANSISSEHAQGHEERTAIVIGLTAAKKKLDDVITEIKQSEGL